MEDDDMNYVRFLLIFKLWKQVVVTGEERNSINRLAVAKLSPPRPMLLKKISQGFFLKVLPTLPYDKAPELVTRFYMTSRFKLRDAINVSIIYMITRTYLYLLEPFVNTVLSKFRLNDSDYLH